jgi:hypothetical protein
MDVFLVAVVVKVECQAGQVCWTGDDITRRPEACLSFLLGCPATTNDHHLHSIPVSNIIISIHIIIDSADAVLKKNTETVER